MTTNPLEELDEQMTLHEVDQIIKALEPSLKRRGWTPPDITELMEEAQQCYSITGLKEFIAKHHPDYALECRKQNPAEWLPLNECEFEEVDGNHTCHNTPTEAAVKIIKHGPAAVRVRRKKW